MGNAIPIGPRIAESLERQDLVDEGYAIEAICFYLFEQGKSPDGMSSEDLDREVMLFHRAWQQLVALDGPAKGEDWLESLESQWKEMARDRIEFLPGYYYWPARRQLWMSPNASERSPFELADALNKMADELGAEPMCHVVNLDRSHPRLAGVQVFGMVSMSEELQKIMKESFLLPESKAFADLEEPVVDPEFPSLAHGEAMFATGVTVGRARMASSILQWAQAQQALSISTAGLLEEVGALLRDRSDG